MVGAFIGFAAAAKRSTPWQPVREEVKQPAPAGSAESVRQVLAETVEGLRAGTVSKQVADSVLRVAKVQLAVAEQGGGLLAAAPEKAKGAAVKRWLHSRGYVRASKGGRTAWLPAEQFGWQSA